MIGAREPGCRTMSEMSNILHLALLSVFPALALHAALHDFRHYRIPNWLNLAIVGAFFPVAWLAGMPWDVFIWHLAAFGVVLATMFAVFMLLPASKFGGGDAKMIAAVAIWIDWNHLLEFGIMTALAGGVLAAIMWLWRVLQIEYGVWMQGDSTLRKVMSYNVKLPYGAAIAAGGIYAYTLSWWQTLIAG